MNLQVLAEVVPEVLEYEHYDQYIPKDQDIDVVAFCETTDVSETYGQL